MQITLRVLLAVVALLWTWPASAATAFSKSLLAVAVANVPPGKSIYSAEILPECGSDPSHAACPLERVCDRPSLLCAPPRWSKARNAWVKCETPETAVKRYAVIVESLARTARRLAACRIDGELPNEDCRPMKGWPVGAVESLAMAGLVTAVGESGLVEATEYGYAPMGRGRDGEATLVQMMTRQIPRLAGWLPQEERERLANVSNDELETWVQAEILGEKNLDHMWEAGLRGLANARSSCKSSTDWAYSMYSMYGSGVTCSASGKFARQRSNWFAAWSMQRKTAKLPEWASAALEPTTDAPAVALVPTE